MEYVRVPFVLEWSQRCGRLSGSPSPRLASSRSAFPPDIVLESQFFLKCGKHTTEGMADAFRWKTAGLLRNCHCYIFIFRVLFLARNTGLPVVAIKHFPYNYV